MKMPSTYISLFLFCGLMLFYAYAHHHSKPVSDQPLVKVNKPVVKRFWPAHQHDVPLDKNSDGYEKELPRAGLTINGFSFFKDVICNMAPVLKHGR